MKHIYYKDAKGKKVRIEVTDEVAAAYRESLREEWRGDAKENIILFRWINLRKRAMKSWRWGRMRKAGC